MDIKDILLVLQDGPADEVAAAVAARIANRGGGGGAVTGLCTFSTPTMPVGSYAIGSAAISQVYDDLQRMRDEQVAKSEALFHGVMGKAGVTAVWATPARDESAKVTAARARTVDVSIIGRTSDNRDLIQELVFSSGTPCLIMPEMSAPPAGLNRVVVAWNGSREAKHALDSALPFLVRATFVEVVTTDGSDQPVGDAQVNALIEHLAHHGVTAQFLRISRDEDDVAGALRRHCAVREADLLVMGAYSHSPAQERLFGGVTQSLLTHASLPILATH